MAASLLKDSSQSKELEEMKGKYAEEKQILVDRIGRLELIVVELK